MAELAELQHKAVGRAALYRFVDKAWLSLPFRLLQLCFGTIAATVFLECEAAHSLVRRVEPLSPSRLFLESPRPVQFESDFFSLSARFLFQH